MSICVGDEKKKRSQPGHNPKRWPAPDSILFAAPRVLHFQTTCVLYSQIPSAAAPVVGQVLWALVYVMTAKQHTHTVRLTDLLHGQHCGKPKLNHYQHFHLLNWHAAGCKILFHGSVQRAQESKHCVWRPGSCHAIGNIPTTKKSFFFFTEITTTSTYTDWPQISYDLLMKAPFTFILNWWLLQFVSSLRVTTCQ